VMFCCRRSSASRPDLSAALTSALPFTFVAELDAGTVGVHDVVLPLWSSFLQRCPMVDDPPLRISVD